MRPPGQESKNNPRQKTATISRNSPRISGIRRAWPGESGFSCFTAASGPKQGRAKVLMTGSQVLLRLLRLLFASVGGLWAVSLAFESEVSNSLCFGGAGSWKDLGRLSEFFTLRGEGALDYYSMCGKQGLGATKAKARHSSQQTGKRHPLRPSKQTRPLPLCPTGCSASSSEWFLSLSETSYVSKLRKVESLSQHDMSRLRGYRWEWL